MNSIGERKAPRQTQREQLQQDLEILRTTPGVCWLTLFCLDLSVLANTTVAEASQELVIQALVPLRTHESPSSRAVVEAAPASLPLPARNTELGTHPPRPRASILALWLPSTKYLRLGLQTLYQTFKDSSTRTRGSEQAWDVGHLQAKPSSPYIGGLLVCPGSCSPSQQVTVRPTSMVQDSRTTGPKPASPIWGHLASLCHPDPEVRRPRTPHCAVPGSLRAKQPILSPLVKGVTHCFFCCEDPNFRMGPK